MKFATVDPRTNTLEKEFPFASKPEIETVIDKASTGFKKYSATSFADRAAKTMKLAELIEARAKDISEIMQKEMGKPEPEATGEVMKTAGFVRYFAEKGEDFMSPEEIDMGYKKAMSVPQPLGPILSIQPWNFPFFLPFKCGFPAIIAGNTVVMKPAPSVPQCSLAIQQLYLDAGFDEGVFSVLFAHTDEVESIIANPKIRGVTLTGSCGAGKAVAALSGKYMKKCMFELGGSDPFVVLDDADIDLAVVKGAAGRLMNSGQACINAKRFIIYEGAYEAFKEKLVAHVDEKYKIGENIGPIARMDLLDHLKKQVKIALEHGAKAFHGDVAQLDAPSDAEGKGYYFSPVFIENITPENPAYHFEFFGPVFSLFKVKSEEEAVALANDVDYGLGGAVFSKDEERAKKVAL